MIKYLFFTFFFTFFSIFCFSDIYLDCKNPEKLGYKKDFYLLKINDRFKQGSYLAKSKSISKPFSDVLKILKQATKFVKIRF